VNRTKKAGAIAEETQPSHIESALVCVCPNKHPYMLLNGISARRSGTSAKDPQTTNGTRLGTCKNSSDIPGPGPRRRVAELAARRYAGSSKGNQDVKEKRNPDVTQVPKRTAHQYPKTEACPRKVPPRRSGEQQKKASMIGSLLHWRLNLPTTWKCGEGVCLVRNRGTAELAQRSYRYIRC